MKIAPRRLSGTFEITLQPHPDARGHFVRWYDRELLARAGCGVDWVQANESVSVRHVLRGLHFQRPPHAETKLVRAVTGAIYDVFVDLRKGSATYGEWDAVELSDAAQNALFLPKGFAHGFYVRSERAVVSYMVDSPYAPQAEGGLAWNDPALAIPWPLEGEPILSPRDRAWPPLTRVEPL
jgi:dTDP-4-dehydrorhamnose 3,5-epimerase